MAGSDRLRLGLLGSLWFARPGSLFYLLVPVAMYLMHSVASSAVCPLAINQSISLAVSVAVMLCSMPFYLLPGLDLSFGFPLLTMLV